MDLSSNNYLPPSTLFSSQGGATFDSNPFLDSFPDPLCKLNLKETSEFVKSFPVSSNGTEISTHRNSGDISYAMNSLTLKRNAEAPPTPGRPVFSFSNSTFSGKSTFPSKWDDAEKWLVGGGGDSPANNGHALFRSLGTSRMYSKQYSGYKPHMGEIFSEKSRITAEEKVSKVLSTLQGPIVLQNHHHSSTRAIKGSSLSTTPDVLPKDEFPNDMNPVSPEFGCSEPMQEGFLFGNSVKKSLSNNNNKTTNSEMVREVKHRDVGTEMTPLASNTTSRCPTPFKSTSPARHNTPANRSGPLAPVTADLAQLQECHLAKLQRGSQFDSVTSNWSSREEEEEDVSKSLRHFEMSGELKRSVSESKSCAWEEEEKTKSCLRYQREEAKIQAWVNLQSAKAEAESRKLEVKIQKMRSNMEEKLMNRMANVHRKAEEWRATAQFQHSEQIRKAGRDAKTRMSNSHISGHKSCGCFPCNKHRI